MAEGSWPYPMIDKPLPLPDGDSVHLYSIIIFHARSGKKSASLHYGTTIAQRETAALERQAERVAAALNEFAEQQQIGQMTAQICRTRAQAESRELSTEVIPLARAPDGTWRADPERHD